MECDTSTVIHVECPLNAHNSLLSLGTLWSVQIRLKPPRLWKSPRSRRARLISMFQASTPSTAKRAESIPRPSSSHLSLSSALNPTESKISSETTYRAPSNLSSSTKSKQWPLWLEHANSSGRKNLISTETRSGSFKENKSISLATDIKDSSSPMLFHLRPDAPKSNGRNSSDLFCFRFYCVKFSGSLHIARLIRIELGQSISMYCLDDSKTSR